MVITDIKNTKIKVGNRKHSDEIQDAAAEFGYSFSDGTKFKKNITHYFFDLDGDLTQLDNGDDDFFYSCEEKEIWFYNGEFHDKPQDEIHTKSKFKKEVRAISKLRDLGFIYHNGEWISKEEIKKQERLEAAYDLYLCAWHEGVKGWGNTLSFEDFCLSVEKNHMSIDYLAIVDKTGYRKGEL